MERLGRFCSDGVAQSVGVEDGGVDIAAGHGVADAVDDEAAIRVVHRRLRSQRQEVGGDDLAVVDRREYECVVEVGVGCGAVLDDDGVDTEPALAVLCKLIAIQCNSSAATEQLTDGLEGRYDSRVSQPEVQRQVRQQRADIDALYELVERVDQKVDALDVKLDVLVRRVDQRVDALDVKLDGLVKRVDQRVDALDVKLDGLAGRVDLKVDALDLKLDRRIDEMSAQLSEVLRQLGGR